MSYLDQLSTIRHIRAELDVLEAAIQAEHDKRRKAQFKPTRLAFSPGEVGKIIGVATSTIHLQIEKGTIPARRLDQHGRRWLIPRSWLVENFDMAPARPPEEPGNDELA